MALQGGAGLCDVFLVTHEFVRAPCQPAVDLVRYFLSSCGRDGAFFIISRRLVDFFFSSFIYDAAQFDFFFDDFIFVLGYFSFSDARTPRRLRFLSLFFDAEMNENTIIQETTSYTCAFSCTLRSP